MADEPQSTHSDGDPAATNVAPLDFVSAIAADQKLREADEKEQRRAAANEQKDAVRREAASLLIYTMLTKGEEYTDQWQDYYAQCYRERVLRALSQRAAKLGMKMVAIEQPA